MTESIDIVIQPTPNPNALKFILDRQVKDDGKSTYRTPEEAEANSFAQKFFDLRGVDQIHFFQNVITISKFSYREWEELEPEILKVVDQNIDAHDPSYKDPNPEAERRAALTPELQKIEEILDKTIRPGLQGDGGDLNCLSYQDNILIIRYQGACGTCPSSTSGTLHAITAILQDEFDPDIEVYTAPPEF